MINFVIIISPSLKNISYGRYNIWQIMGLRNLIFMESKLKELIGQSNVWLFIKSSNGWLKNVEILEVGAEIVTFRYQHESASEVKIWEKTTRLDNILEVDIRLVAMPKCEQQILEMKQKFTRLMEQE